MNQERLYQLLPALYRQRDAEQGESLRALLAVLESELDALEADIEATYDNWFIETCDSWVMPYIADMLGVELDDSQPRWFNQRRLIANTLGYRRRKGTAAVLENAIKDMTGRYAYVVEFERQVARTWHSVEVGQEHSTTLDLSLSEQASLAAGALRDSARSVDLRRMNARNTALTPVPWQDDRPGLYGLRRLGILLWRMHYYPVNLSGAFPLDDQGSGRYTFHPLGLDMPLYVRPDILDSMTERPEPYNLPLPLTRAMLAADLASYRDQYGHLPFDKRPRNTLYYGPARSFNIIYPHEAGGGRAGQQVDPLDLISTDLSEYPVQERWQLLTEGRAEDAPAVAVDVERGRIAFHDTRKRYFASETRYPFVAVSYTYGFSGDIGGGPYDRRYSLAYMRGETPPDFYISVAKNAQDDGDSPMVRSMTRAIERWEKHCQTPGATLNGHIEILDNGRYSLPWDSVLSLPAGSRLLISARAGFQPSMGAFADVNQLRILPGPGSHLALNGLLIGCPVIVGDDESNDEAIEDSASVSAEHCTFIVNKVEKPFSTGGIRIARYQTPHMHIDMRACIVERLRASDKDHSASLRDSIVHHRLDGLRLRLDYVTVLEKAADIQLEYARGVIFAGRVDVESWSPTDVQYCAFAGGLWRDDETQHAQLHETNVAEEKALFDSETYGEPAYARLSLSTSMRIRRGAHDGSEMGAFHYLYQPQREDNIAPVIDEYAPVGYDIGVFYVT